MKISRDQTNQKPLADFGAELVQMIKDRSCDLIADRFGYAMAYERPLADAIATDIDRCLTDEGRSAIIDLTGEARIIIKHFEPNTANLSRLVECFLPLTNDDGELLAEIIVTAKNNEYWLTLEDVSYRSSNSGM